MPADSFIAPAPHHRRPLFSFLHRTKDELPPSHPSASSPLPLEVGPLNTARGLGERYKLPSVSGGEAPADKRIGAYYVVIL